MGNPRNWPASRPLAWLGDIRGLRINNAMTGTYGACARRPLGHRRSRRNAESGAIVREYPPRHVLVEGIRRIHPYRRKFPSLVLLRWWVGARRSCMLVGPEHGLRCACACWLLAGVT
jgi:hypothetical protein